MSSNSISDITEGITKGVLEFSKGQISSFIKKFRERKLAFIEDQKTIDIVREQYNSGESKFYKIYIKDKSILFMTRLGLTLRRLEENKEKQQNLRSKILKRYGVEGLHLAEFVQNGILNRYIIILLEKFISTDKLEKDIEEILKNIEKYTLFVQGTSKKAEIIKKAETIVNAHSPRIYIISGFKSAAKLVRDSLEQLTSILKNYNFERWSEGEKEILFFKRDFN